MKKIILLTVLVIGYCLPTFSQLNSRFQTNRLPRITTSPNFSLKNRTGTLRLGDSTELKAFMNDPEKYKNSLDPKYKYEFLHKGQNLIGIIKTPLPVDDMPCIKPKGNFPMPVYQPDSTVNYTLKIKYFKSHVN